jgi:aryl-alcohol dehydrogenase-like predicted oxidoreductase
MTPELCLGTAQFGLAYGITNLSGQVPEHAIAHLLALAEDASIVWLDTAQAYGNAEAVLGRQISRSHRFRLISKLQPQAQTEFAAQDQDAWEHDFSDSCRRLGVPSLDALLLHAPADLRKPGGHYLESWLLSLRERGCVRRLGVSIYTAADLQGVNPALLDLVQLPLSLFDQRLLKDGTVHELRQRGVAIHARSIYLQGLLLSPSSQWPGWVAAEVRSHQNALEVLAREKGCRLIDLALGFAKDQQDLEAVVIGLCSVAELRELQAAWSAPSPWCQGEWRSWSLSDSDVLDPRRWPH